MATAETATSRNTSKRHHNNNNNKISTKKILEVKEVIQNRSNNDIQTVLEHYDFDVSNTINAFMNDDAREILHKSRKNIKNNNNNNSGLVATTTTTTMNDNNNLDNTIATATNKSENNNNKRNKNVKIDKNNNLNSNNSNNRKTATKSFNINDLVESIVSKYINPNEQSTTTTTTTSSFIATQPQIISTTIVEPAAAATTTATASQLLINEIRPPPSSSLDLKLTEQQQQQYEPTRYIPTQKTVININAKKILEKSQKDLQRQIVSLNKLNTNFDEEVDKTKQQLRDLFNRLRTVIDVREIQLQSELDKMKSQGNELFANRQRKATEFKTASDIAEYLSETQVQELKNDIKNFVSERKLDEELGMAKRFIYDYEKVESTIKSFGQVLPINTNHYTLLNNKCALNESNNSTTTNSDENTTPSTTPKKMITTKAVPATETAAMKSLNDDFEKVVKIMDTVPVAVVPPPAPIVATKVSNGGNHDGDFIETKKPQRNRNKQVAGVEVKKVEVEVGPKVNGLNGNDHHIDNSKPAAAAARRNNGNRTAAASLNTNDGTTRTGPSTRSMNVNGINGHTNGYNGHMANGKLMNGGGLNGGAHNYHQSAKVNGN